MGISIDRIYISLRLFYTYRTKKGDIMKVERTVAVLLVVVALFFVGYQEFSTFSGAVLLRHVGYEDCIDTDPGNDVTIRGTVTATRLNLDTQTQESIEPRIDECIGPKRVREWLCGANNRPISIERNTYCAQGSLCRDGRCLSR
jgi:hypothetical protein